MASSLDHKQQQQLPNIYGGTTAAPPPTPSTQTNHLSTSAHAEALSRLLHRLPPTLSLPTRRSPALTLRSPPTISFSQTSTPALLDSILTSSSQLGFFQLTDHHIPSQLALSAESESAVLFDLPMEEKESLFPRNWPLGFKGDGEEEADASGESFCLDATMPCSSDSTEMSLHSLQELIRALEKLGLKIVEFLSRAVGFENPIGEDRTRFRSLIWISEGSRSTEPAMAGGIYPYIVGLHYQTRNQKYSLLGDSGWVSAAAQADSVMVSIGDIAQVWSNGKLKKVRGRPVSVASSTDANGGNSRNILVSLLITLLVDSQVSPLLSTTVRDQQDEGDTNAEKFENVTSKNEEEEEEKEEKMVFRSFCFEDYAWRVYQDRCFLLKDPLNRFRI